eukprot:7601169-Lingulodinium_polyedra.AAC.1
MLGGGLARSVKKPLGARRGPASANRTPRREQRPRPVHPRTAGHATPLRRPQVQDRKRPTAATAPIG